MHMVSGAQDCTQGSLVEAQNLFPSKSEAVLSFPQSCISLPSTSASSSRAIACLISSTLMWSLLFLHLGCTFRNSALWMQQGQSGSQLNGLTGCLPVPLFCTGLFFQSEMVGSACHTLTRLCFNSEFVSLRIMLNHTFS